MHRFTTLVPTAAALAALAGSATVPAHSATHEYRPRAAAAGKYRILKSLKYSGPGDVPLRLGYYRDGKGFGWTKIKKKHALTKYSAVEYVTRGPNRKSQGGTSYKMWAYAGKYNCRNGSCRLVKQYKVIVSVQESHRHSGRDHKPKGVITAYCEGVVRCPAWVSTTLSRLDQGLAAACGDSRDAEPACASYTPPASRTRRVPTATAAKPLPPAASYEPFSPDASYEPFSPATPLPAAVRQEDIAYRASYEPLR
jgi:hypothetical protein